MTPPRMNASPDRAKVFVSYSHRDNPEIDGAPGWVMSFVEHLRVKLQQLDDVEVWTDRRIPAHAGLSWVLPDKLRASSALLTLVSPTYLRSDWCQRELAWFLEQRGGVSQQRIFGAELLPIPDRSVLHPVLKDLVLRKFWGQFEDSGIPYPLNSPSCTEADKRAYWKQITELAHWLVERIQRTDEPQAQRPTVWIAATTDELQDRWEELAAALRQAGWEVLPATAAENARSDTELAEALQAPLAQADVLVELLGTVPARKRSLSDSPTQLQHLAMQQTAQQRGCKHLIWRAPALKLEEVVDPAHRQLLTGTTACGFPEFINLVKAALPAPASASTAAKAPPTASTAASTTTDQGNDLPTVCLTADAVDHPLSEEVADVLADLGAGVVMPTPVGNHPSPAEWRQHNDTLMCDADGLLLLYGQAPATWVQSQLLSARKTLSRHGSRTRLSLLDAPPPHKPPAAWRLPNLLTLDCRQGIQRDPLARFVDQLRGGAHA